MSLRSLVRPMKGCTHLARCSVRRSSQTRTLSTSTTTTQAGSSSTPQPTELEQARARAWYLPPTPAPATEAHDTPSTSRPRRTTTFDPSSTTPEAAAVIIPPLPADCPASLKGLHHFLTCEAESIDPSSVVITSTRASSSSTTASLTVSGLGEGADEVISPPGGSARPTWDWVVVATVRGRGKGIVPRAEREVRVWLRDHPSSPERLKTRRVTREEADSDWALIPLHQTGACVNLFTPAGRQHWRIEDVWAEQNSL